MDNKLAQLALAHEHETNTRKRKKWWQQLPGSMTCPISLERLCELRAPPFKLSSTNNTYFEPSALAKYLTTSLRFEHPITREPVPRSACVDLDRHLQRHRLAAPPITVTWAHDARQRAGDTDAGALLATLVREPERDALRGGRGMALIDDDAQPALRRGISAMEAAEERAQDAQAAVLAEEFPCLGGAPSPAPVPPPAACCGFAWGGAAPLQRPPTAAFPALPKRPPSQRPLEINVDGTEDRYLGPVAPSRASGRAQIRSPLHEMMQSNNRGSRGASVAWQRAGA